MLLNAFRRFFAYPALLISFLFAWPFFALPDLLNSGRLTADPDFWWHLRNSEMLLTTHHFIWRDVYSFTTYGQQWLDPEWLSELLYYAGFRLCGERGLFLVMFAALELIIMGVFLLCYRRSQDVNAAFLATLLFVFMASVNVGFRTILLGWLCFIAEMLLLEAFRRGHGHLWMLVPLFALWINLHGSWIFGIVLYVLFFASGLIGGSWGSIEAVRWTPQQRLKLFTVGIVSLAALFINPYGWRLLAYPFELIFRQQHMVGFVQEWASLDFHSAIGKIFFILVAGMVILMLTRPRTWRFHEILFALLALYDALTHMRFLFLAGIILSPLLAVELTGLVFAIHDPRSESESSRNSSIIAGCNAVIITICLVFVWFHIPRSTALRAAEEQYYPVHALPALETSCADQHVFNDSNWGGYLIWNARDIPVFMDSRIDIFDFHGVMADSLQALRINDSLAILDRYRIGCVFLKPEASLVYLLRNAPAWRVQYQDPTAILLVRTVPIAGSDSDPSQQKDKPLSQSRLSSE
jgi:hypothetical protein